MDIQIKLGTQVTDPLFIRTASFPEYFIAGYQVSFFYLEEVF
jgi:hypothetical protein